MKRTGLLARLGAACLALAVALGGIAPAVALAEDAPASTVEIKGKTLKVSKKTARLGQKVMISVKITGKAKQVYAFVYPTARNNDTFKAIPLKKSGTAYKGTVKVTNNMTAGTWRVSYVTAYQADGGYADAWYGGKGKSTLRKVQFKVVGTKGDTSAPVVDTSSIKVGRKTAKAGQKVSFAIPVTDNMSKITTLEVWYTTKSNSWDGVILGTGKYAPVRLKKKGKVYKATFKAPEKKGTFKIERIIVRDDINNAVTYVDKRFKKDVLSELKKDFPKKADRKQMLKHYKFVNLKAYDLKVK